MGDVLPFPPQAERDGSKARIRRRREAIGLDAGNTARSVDDLVMLEADVVDTSPCEMP